MTPSSGFAKAKNIKMVVTAGIGSDHTDLQAACERGVTVAEVTYCNSISVAEHVVMFDDYESQYPYSPDGQFPGPARAVQHAWTLHPPGERPPDIPLPVYWLASLILWVTGWKYTGGLPNVPKIAGRLGQECVPVQIRREAIENGAQ